MTVGLIIMLTLYGGWLVWVVIGFTLCYAIMRLATYQFYRRVAEEQVVKARVPAHILWNHCMASLQSRLSILKGGVRNIGLTSILKPVMLVLNKHASICYSVV
jgi:hypothetical protein